WNNYTDDIFVDFGVTPVSIGPLYLFRNVGYGHQVWTTVPKANGYFVKFLDPGTFGGGRLYVYNNTAFHKGTSVPVPAGLVGAPLDNVVSRNNIFDANRAIVDSSTSHPNAPDLDFDMYSGRLENVPAEQHIPLNGTPTYEPNPSANFPP